MANHKKKAEEKLNPVICHMTDELNAGKVMKGFKK